MRVVKYGLIGLVLVLVIAVAAIAIILNSIVSGNQKEKLVALAEKQLGTKVELDSYSLDMKSVLMLRPSIVLNNLAIANPSGFSKQNLLEAEQVSAKINLSSALSRKITISDLSIDSPRILIEAPSEGATNLETLISNFQKSSPEHLAPTDPTATTPAEEDESMVISVAGLSIADGIVEVANEQNGNIPQPTIRSLNLTLSDLAPGRACRISLSSKFFESKNSSLDLNGTMGPFKDAGLPLNAKSEIVLALAEFPKDFLKRSMGELAAAPGPDSRIHLDVALEGDLYETTTGKGNIKFSKFMIGDDKTNRLDLSGQTPLEIRALKLISAGEIEIRANNAKLQLGSGSWNGNLNALRKGALLQGRVSGSIQSVDVNQMLTSFAATPGKVFGTLTIPKFNLAFAGRTTEAIKQSLNGDGNLRISNGRFQGLSILAAVERALGGADSKATGEFAQFQTSFNVANQRIHMNSIDVDGPGIGINGQGTVTFQEALDFKLQSKLTGNAAELLKAKTAGFMQGDLMIPVTVAGTLDNPQIRPEVKGLARNAVKSTVKGVIEGFFNKRKK